jgi:2-keto-4-pentenoate hydratase/2-oxohepta-3-ene-1,7-dioic acid hydratase in catechol pathway
MKLVTYRYHMEKRLGILIDHKTILDPNYSFKNNFLKKEFYNPIERANDYCPPSLHTLLRLKEKPMDILKEALSIPNDQKYLIDLSTNTVMLDAPLDKIETYRDFFTHQKHVEVGFKKRNEPIPPAWFEIPAYYKGATTSFIGTGDEILWPAYTDVLDYELELGMIIGKDGKNIKVEDAHNYIFGYTILNDISARDIQKKEMTIRLGPAKAKDFCSIIGPVIITADEFQSEPNLLMTAKVNGVEWSRGQSGDAHFSWAQMIAHVAQDEWILAGDLFGSGTVGTGCGLELDKWINPGDVIELEIEKIGKLINKVGKKHGKL